MKLAYIVTARIPTEKAHGYQISKMCSEFSRAGAEVRLIVPHRKNLIVEDLFSYYGLDKKFAVEHIDCFDAVRFSKFLGKFAFFFQTQFFIRALRNTSVDLDTVVYTRNPEVASMYCKKGNRVIYDAHNFSEAHSARLLGALNGVWGIVANSAGTAEEFTKRGFKRVLVAHNGVDIREFDIPVTKKDARRQFGLSESAQVATYVGHLYSWKGIDMVLEAAKILPEITFVVAGGTSEDISKYKVLKTQKSLENLVILGHLERGRIPHLLKASDLLLLPNIAISKESEKYTSPLKMFEYMASGTPIVASRLPSIGEVLNETNATLFEAGNVQAFVEAITGSYAQTVSAAEKALKARRDVEQYSWSGRAMAILNFIKG